MAVATYVAVALNVAVARLGLMLARATPQVAAERGGRGPVQPAHRVARTVYVAIALSGFTALAAQVLWTRLLSLPFGATAYTFSLILGGFLFGLGIGSSIGAAIAQGPPTARGRRSAGVRCCCAARSRGPPYMLMASMPYWPINPSISSDVVVQLPDRLAALPVGRAARAILWGASFPLALAAVAAPGQDPGTPRGRRLRRQHRRRHRRLGRRAGSCS